METNNIPEQGQQGRPIQLDPESMQALGAIDNVISLAPLTRTGHMEAQKSLAKVAQTIEALQSQVAGMAKELSSLKGQGINEVSERVPSSPSLLRR